MSGKIKDVLNAILKKFQTGQIPKAIAYACFPGLDVPSAAWSLLNRTIMFLSGTADARGFRQWQKVGRQVKKGSHAFYILVPVYKKTVDDETKDENKVLAYFKPAPVFAFEDTKGKPLDQKPIKLAELPLLRRARKWKISVRAVPGNYRFYGAYSTHRKEIALATPQECVFFHELSHAAHERVAGRLKGGQEPLQEIVAELSAQALCWLVGKQPGKTMGNSYRYIDHYAKKLKLTPHTACLKVFSQTEKVLQLILKGDGFVSSEFSEQPEDENNKFSISCQEGLLAHRKAAQRPWGGCE